MALEQKLSLRMSQRLVMTPSLQQAIKLLQMSKLDLVEEVQQELLENPVLEEGQLVDSPSAESAPIPGSSPPRKFRIGSAPTRSKVTRLAVVPSSRYFAARSGRSHFSYNDTRRCAEAIVSAEFSAVVASTASCTSRKSVSAFA